MLRSLPLHTFRPVRRTIASSFTSSSSSSSTSSTSSTSSRRYTTLLARRSPSSTTNTTMAPSLLALAASAGNNVLMNEKTLHKLQGAQLFVGSGVAFFFAAHRWQVGREGERKGREGRRKGLESCKELNYLWEVAWLFSLRCIGGR